MKKLLATAAAIAVAMSSTAAHADNIAWTGTTPLGTTGAGPYFFGLPLGQLGYGVAIAAGSPGYDQAGTNAGNIEAASPTVTNTWLIKGAVSKDCSFYGGASTSHTLDFGTIGVNTQSATSVNNAFDMVSNATATVNSTTAGCNFNNTVTLKKANGNKGLLNSVATGYDTNEFQANIPYSVAATFKAGASGAVAAAPSQTLTASTGDSDKVGSYGAWRSDVSMVITAPTPGKALVAGDYQDTLTVELKAI
jgi:hypothetical protein